MTDMQPAGTDPLRFGLQLTSVHPASGPARRQVEEHTELVELAESYGFDFIGAGQHFLTPELRYFQPVPYLSYFAARTTNLRLATGILLLPLHNPVDIAEQVATLDVLSGGRAVMGVGLGYADHEFQAFGVDRAHRVSRLEEALQVIRALWSGEASKHDGRHFAVDTLQAGVLPVQRPGPPIWSAGQTAVAVRRAARTADAWYVPPFVTHAELVDLAAGFRAERDRCELPPASELPVRREMVIADHTRQALTGAAARVESRMATYVKWGMGRDYRADSLTGEEESDLRGRFVLGTPEECAEQLLQLRSATGMTHFVLKPQWPGLPHEEAVRQIIRFGDEVVPLLRG